MSTLSSHVAGRVRSAMTELGEQGEALVALGTALQDLAALPGTASPDELKHVSHGVSATALRAHAAVLGAALVAERLATLGRALETEGEVSR